MTSIGKPSTLLLCVRTLFLDPGFTQSLGGHRADFMGVKAGQAFAKTSQAIPAALHGLGGQVALFIQSAALAHRFFQIFGATKLTVIDLPNFKSKAVRAQSTAARRVPFWTVNIFPLSGWAA